MWSRDGSTSSARSRMSSAVRPSCRARRAVGRRRMTLQHAPGDQRREDHRAERSELGLAEQPAVESEARDQQRDGEADPGTGAAGHDHRRRQRRARSVQRRPCRKPGPGRDAHRLADDIADQDAERHRRGDRLGQQRSGHVHAGVGEREQRHDHVAGPRVQAVLESLVGRDRRQQPLARGPRQLRRRLLAKRVRQRDAALQILARG